MADLILETTFLIDLERELRQGKDGPAKRFLASRAEDRLYLTFTIVGEMAAGASMADREVWQEFVAPFLILESNREVAWPGRPYPDLPQSSIRLSPASSSRG